MEKPVAIDLSTIKVVKRLVYPRVCTVVLLSNGIIELQWDQELKMIEKEHLIQIRNIVGEFGKKAKMPVYVATIDFLTMTPEAREYSASEDAQEYTLGNAVLVDNVAKKILFNFFIRMNNPPTPTKAFANREAAFQWLLELPMV